MSFSTSTRMPPSPTTISGPNSGSLRAPTTISITLRHHRLHQHAIDARRRRHLVGVRHHLVDRPTRTASASRRFRRMTPASVLCGRSGDSTFITTGYPSAAAAFTASSADCGQPLAHHRHAIQAPALPWPRAPSASAPLGGAISARVSATTVPGVARDDLRPRRPLVRAPLPRRQRREAARSSSGTAPHASHSLASTTPGPSCHSVCQTTQAILPCFSASSL